MEFRVLGGPAVDNTDVTAVPLGRRLPGGLFVCQESGAYQGNQIYKLVP